MICNPFHQPIPGFSVLYVFGAGGHGREVAWLAEQSWGQQVRILHVVDRREFLSDAVNGNEVCLLDEVRSRAGDRFIVAVGDSALRRRAAAACAEIGLLPATIVHPRVEASRTVVLGEGSILCAGSIVTSNVTIGQHVHVNIGCTISHDVAIGDFSTLSPGVHVSGHVHIGQDVFIGTGASIINGSAGNPLVIANNAVIAAGACVIHSIEAGALVAGVPAIRKR